MSMYICANCDELLDGDYDPCVSHPWDISLYCCESCADELEVVRPVLVSDKDLSK